MCIRDRYRRLPSPKRLHACGVDDDAGFPILLPEWVTLSEHKWVTSRERRSQGTLNMGLASCFSAREVVPLTLLMLDAWDFIKLRKAQCPACGHDLAWGQKWAIYFLMAVGVWNFVGAGIFGFLINLPIMSYFEVGTTLTPNHGHAALFGVFGMLALAVLVFCLRALQSDATWKETQKFVRVGFWGANVGLALMIILDMLPGGVIQLWDSIANGYWHARRLTFVMGGTYHKLEWPVSYTHLRAHE